MKTLKLFSVISLALILFGVNSVYSRQINNRYAMSPSAIIRYQVIVHLHLDFTPCSIYLVQMVDAQGNYVAPPQVFVPGKANYSFYERGPVTGVRIARLVLAPNMGHFACPPGLFCNPDVKTGKFLIGESYQFNLYPATEPTKE